jgi:hypothetical protein
MTPHEATKLWDVFTDWADQQPSLRALALVGFWARRQARDDSDLDLVALATDVNQWTADDTWLRDLLGEFGFSVVSASLEAHGVARSWRVWLGRVPSWNSR